MATMAVKGYNKNNLPLTSEGEFADVQQSHWAYENINRSITSNLMEGKSDCFFKPDGKLTRLEALNIIGKGMTCPMSCEQAEQILSHYSDGARVPADMRENVAKAIDAGALKHQNQKTISINREASRAEVSTMLQNMRLAIGLDNARVACDSSNLDIMQTRGLIEKETMMNVPTIEMQMADIINSKNANVGDRFAAYTVNDVTIDGVLYPAGSRVDGRVMEVVRPSKGCEGAIRLSFNQIKNCDGCKADLPKQILTARVDDAKSANVVARVVQLPFTWAGSLIGTAGRTVGGAFTALSNAVEDVFDNVGTGTGELLTGQFCASGRSYGDAIKSTVIAPVDLTRTAFSGAAGLFETTGDEFTYLVSPSGTRISQVNPKQKITVAFGQ
ncbi:s-layer domain-containing protein [Candidatus Gastranaerophilus sp. (ex Termes propinquus)]|nr:s-layer domain-containing protein [Candidatus Gastranaerophilus sp. (ex Termes propinquus)]